MAVDGEIYFGGFSNSTSRAYPDGGTPEYILGVEVGQKIYRFRPYLGFESILDKRYNHTSFEPGSIRYNIGVSMDIWKGVYLDAHHSCWHPVDQGGTVEEYNLITIRYKFNQ